MWSPKNKIAQRRTKVKEAAKKGYGKAENTIGV